MKLIKEASFTTDFGTFYGIQIEIDGNAAIEKPIPMPDISADSILESTVEISYHETVDKVAYFIIIYASLGSVKVAVSGNVDASKNISVILLQDYECPVPEDPTPSSRIDTYVPMIKYTRTAKEICDFALDGCNKRIIPVLDIRKEEQIKEYVADSFIIPHFLDLCGLQKDTTVDEHSRVIKIRKEQKKRGIDIKSRIKIPDKDYVDLDENEKFVQYISLPITSNVVPVWRISTKNKPDSLYAGLVIALFDMYDSGIALRVMETDNFLTNIESYLDPFKGNLDQCYLIIELLEDNRGYEWGLIQKIESLACGIQVIFAKQTLDYEHITIKTNRLNLLPNTSLGSFYEHNLRSIEELWYADYCGYDRDTATVFIIGMKPNASLHLLDFSDGMQMMILKIKHVDEKGTGAWSKSAAAMANIVKTHPNVKSFIDCKHCEACEFVCDAKTFTLENEKVACMKHNVRVIATL